MIQIKFEMSYEGITFRDAIALPDDHSLTDEQIDQIKQKRLADWIATMQPVEEE